MKRIFYADDDHDDIEIFKLAIEKIAPEAEIVCADNCTELLALLKTSLPHPDFVFLDLNMPVMTGHECLLELKNDATFKDLRICILTTSKHPEDIASTYEKGADFYICKPSGLSEYERTLQKLFKMDNSQRIPKEKFVLNLYQG